MARRSLKKNRHLPEESSSLEGYQPGTTYGSHASVYMATMINPKDHRLYDLVAFGDDVYIMAPADTEDYLNPEIPLVNFGNGYLDTGDERTLSYYGETSDYIRCHTPSGVSKKQTGLGLMLYSGLSMATILKSKQNGGCFSEDSGPRSQNAEDWWTSQVDRGYAEEDSETVEVTGSGELSNDADRFADSTISETYGSTEQAAALGIFGEEMEDDNIRDVTITPSTGYIETFVYAKGVIEKAVQFLPIKKVAQSGLLLAWSDEDDDLKNILEDNWDDPPAELLVELDLSTTTSTEILRTILDIVLSDKSLTEAKVNKFLSHLPTAAVSRSDILEMLGQQKLPMDLVANSRSHALQTNKKADKHSSAWKKNFKHFL